MTYIINPAWFYWVNVIDDLKSFIFAMEFIAGIALVCMVIIGFVDSLFEKKTYCDVFKYFLLMFGVSSILFILIPSKETMYQMMVAQYISAENLTLSVEAVKDAVAYIVQAIAEVT